MNKKYNFGGILGKVGLDLFLKALKENGQPTMISPPMTNNTNPYGLRDGGNPDDPKPIKDIFQQILEARPEKGTHAYNKYLKRLHSIRNSYSDLPKSKQIEILSKSMQEMNEKFNYDPHIIATSNKRGEHIGSNRLQSYKDGRAGYAANQKLYDYIEYQAVADRLQELGGSYPYNKYAKQPETYENNKFIPSKIFKPFPNYPNKYAFGGQPSGFKQYNSPTHEMGGVNINEEGNIDPNSTIEAEGKENKYTYNTDGSTYVFSDRNQTSQKVRDIISKYDTTKVDQDLPTKTAMEMEIKQVEKLNEAMNAARAAVENVMQARYGKKLAFGGDPLQEDLSQLTTDNPIDLVTDSMIPQSTFNYQPLMTDVSNNVSPLNPLPTAINASSDLGYSDVKSNLDQAYNTPLNNSSKNILGNIDFASILRTAGIVGSGIDAFQRPDVEETILPNYTQSDERFDRMSADLTQAREDAVGASNRASELNRNASSSYSQYRSREVNNINNLQDALGKIGMNEQQLRNNIASTQGQYEASKAVTEAQIKDNVQQRNLANKARVQDLRKQFMSDIVHEADRMSTAKDIRNISQAKIKEGMNILKQIAPDFSINENFVTNLIKVSQGKLDVSELNDEELIVFNKINKE